MSKVVKSVPVKMNYCGKEVDREVGFYTRKRPVSTPEGWKDGPEDEIIFGYSHESYMTHMCYGNLVSGVNSWEEFAITAKHARKFEDFYFDAGGNGRPLYIKYDELRRAMAELGLISAESIISCEGCTHPKAMHDESTGGECTKIEEESNDLTSYCMCAAYGPKDSEDVSQKHPSEEAAD